MVDNTWPLKCDRRAAVLCVADDACLNTILDKKLGIRTHRNKTPQFHFKNADFPIIERQKLIYVNFCTKPVPYTIVAHDRFDEVNGAKVVAIRPINKNIVLFELCGQLYAVSDHFLIPGVNDFSTVTSCINDKDLMFLGPVSFVNHDCSPNVQWHSRSKSLSCVKTIKNIQTNEEILVSYGPHFFGTNNIECKCKTCETNCRGFFSVKESVTMDLIQQDAVAQPIGINSLTIKKRDNQNIVNDDDNDDDRSSPSNFNTNTAVTMDLIQQDAVAQPIGINSLTIKKRDNQNIVNDDDNDDDRSSPSNFNTNTAVTMDLIQQDAVAQPIGINSLTIKKRDNQNIVNDDDNDGDSDTSDGDNGDDDDDDDRSNPSNFNTNTAVSMDLIQQDAVTQPTGIDNGDDDDDDDRSSPIDITALSMDLILQNSFKHRTEEEIFDDSVNSDIDDDDDISDCTNYNANAYQCDKCDRNFKFRSWFKNHKTTHVAVGKHQCNYCPKKFKRRDNLKRHFLSHFGGVNYDCTLCGQPFHLKFNLSTHIKMKHSVVDLHKCTHCEMTFKDIRNKRYHENVKHNNVYPFECPCGAKFGAPNSLWRHRRAHDH